LPGKRKALDSIPSTAKENKLIKGEGFKNKKAVYLFLIIQISKTDFKAIILM
jgi:hypothetical protein